MLLGRLACVPPWLRAARKRAYARLPRVPSGGVAIQHAWSAQLPAMRGALEGLPLVHKTA